MKYCLVSDDDGHDYVIPADKRDEWNRLIDDEMNEAPDWAYMISVAALTFEMPLEFGEKLFNKAT